MVRFECAEPTCGELVPDDRPVVADAVTGALYCDAFCHHTHFYGIRPPVTQEEEVAFARARDWMRRHRPERRV